MASKLKKTVYKHNLKEKYIQNYNFTFSYI